MLRKRSIQICGSILLRTTAGVVNDSTVKKIADALSVEADEKPTSSAEESNTGGNEKNGDFEPVRRERPGGSAGVAL
ncbi:MAG: hypothetical protein ACLUTU_03455 [Blautia faecis]